MAQVSMHSASEAVPVRSAPSDRLGSDDRRVDCHGFSNRGRRETNEDQFLIAELSKSLLVEQTSLRQEDHSRLFGRTQGYLLAVADGIGRERGGGVASAVAVDTLAHYVVDVMPWFFGLDSRHEDDLEEELKAAMARCQSRIRAATGPKGRLGHAGTTLTIAYVLWPRAYIVHVGDSRGYLLHSRRLERITRDHTVAQQLEERGALSPREAETSRWRHLLWNRLGEAGERFEPEVYGVDLAPGDSLLLCTDGLTSQLGDEDIAADLVDSAPAAQVCRNLVSQALEAGATDNISVVVARFA
jgi:serine/threonine protein phosphatase PrpC